YLRKAPELLRFINVGNSRVRLNLVPVDFVVEGIAALSEVPEAIGKTIALADPDPLTTAQLFDAIASEMTGKRSVVAPPVKLVEWSLLQSISPPITGLPNHAVPYFFISQTYDTSIANELLGERGVRLLITSQLAGDYFNLRQLDSELAILNRTVEALQKGLDLVNSRHQGGVASGLDVAQEET